MKLDFYQLNRFMNNVTPLKKNATSDAHTLINDQDLEIMVVLRMNRKFMEYMRTHFSHLTKQQFVMTMVTDIQPLN